MSFKVEHLSLRRAGRPVLIDANLELQPGQVHALLGPNGAGKSSLLGVLAGDLHGDAGRVSLDGQTLADWPRRALARRRAVMLQREHLPFPFTAEQVVALGRLPWAADPAHPRERAVIRRSLARAGAEALAGRPYTALSGGERSRVQLARALAQIDEASLGTAPAYLLLDEPTASLDFAFVHDCLAQIRERAQAGLGVLVVLHDPLLAARYADVLSVMSQGRVLATGSARQVLDPAVLAPAYGLAADRLRSLIAGRPDAGLNGNSVQA